MDYVLAVLLVLVFCGCWVLTLLSLPGNWILAGAAAFYAWLGPAQERTMAIGLGVVIALVAMAAVGELLELAAAALGAAKGGGSKRGALLAVIGSFVGGLVGLFVGIPIPVLGPIVAAVLFAGLGALGGAVMGELWKGRTMDHSLRVGHAAFWGRILGTMAKVMIASMMVVTGTVALFVGGS